MTCACCCAWHRIDSRTLQSIRESGGRVGYGGAKRRKGSKVHLAVDTLGHLLTLHVTPADQQDREQVAELAQTQAQDFDMDLVVVKHTEATRGFVLLPRRWVVERSITWAARFRRLACDYERLADTLAVLHFVAFACLMLSKAAAMLEQGS
jgi:transposase